MEQIKKIGMSTATPWLGHEYHLKVIVAYLHIGAHIKVHMVATIQNV